MESTFTAQDLQVRGCGYANGGVQAATIQTYTACGSSYGKIILTTSGSSSEETQLRERLTAG